MFKNFKKKKNHDKATITLSEHDLKILGVVLLTLHAKISHDIKEEEDWIGLKENFKNDGSFLDDILEATINRHVREQQEHSSFLHNAIKNVRHLIAHLPEINFENEELQKKFAELHEGCVTQFDLNH